MTSWGAWYLHVDLILSADSAEAMQDMAAHEQAYVERALFAA